MTAHQCLGDRCEQIRRLRGLRWGYGRIIRSLHIPLTELLQSVRAHSRVIRDGAASCIECRRLLDARVPATGLLQADECCLWCGRRHDGDSRNVIPLLARLAHLDTHGLQGPAQDLRTWNPRVRANSARK